MRVISPRDAAILLFVMAAGIIAAFFPRAESNASAVIEKNGSEIYSVALENASDAEFTLPETEGVVYEISDGAIRIKSSACEERLCEKRGFINRRGETIVCLPQRLIITITGGREEFDAVVG